MDVLVKNLQDLILTRDKAADIDTAANYVKSSDISNFVAFGGTSAIPDPGSVDHMFSLIR